MRLPHVYFLRPLGAEGPVKIGHSVWAWQRLRIYMSWSPVPLEMVAKIDGGGEIERRFHAMFREQHSHHEWFHASPLLTETINRINAGTFDLDELPEPCAIYFTQPKSRESVEAMVFSRRLTRLREAGAYVPPEVLEASNTYNFPEDEKARRRAIVKEFVLSSAVACDSPAPAKTHRNQSSILSVAQRVQPRPSQWRS